jgi:hypothetical protein
MDQHEMILLSADMKSVYARLSQKVHKAGVAQSAEYLIRNQDVRGSIPRPGSSSDSQEVV